MDLTRPLPLPAIDRRKLAGALLLAGVFAMVTTVAYFIIGSIPYTNDWERCIRPAAVALLQAQSPYLTSCFYNPPWALIPLLPLALLPPHLGSLIIAEACVVAFFFVSKRMGTPRWGAAAVALSPLVLVCAIMGNIEWLVALGFVLPPQIGLFFVLVKPQAGIAVAAFWTIQAWQRGGIHEVVKLLTPITGITLLSFLLYGFWPGYMAGMNDSAGNWSLWPWSILIGLLLLAWAAHSKNIRTAIIASPFLSPYVMMTTWAIPFLGLFTQKGTTDRSSTS